MFNKKSIAALYLLSAAQSVKINDDTFVQLLKHKHHHKHHRSQNVDISSPVPACTSIGCAHDKKPKDPHPMNYYVPDFGQDHEITDSLKNLKD